MLVVGTLQAGPGKKRMIGIILKIIGIQGRSGCCPSLLPPKVGAVDDMIEAGIMTLLSSVTYCGDSAAARQSMNDAPQVDPKHVAQSDASSLPAAETPAYSEADAQAEPAEVTESLDAALLDLLELGIRVPRRPTLSRVLLEIWLTSISMRLRGPKRLEVWVEMIDQSQITISQKIDRTISMSFFQEPRLAALLVSRQIRRLLKHGFGETSARSVALFGVMQNSAYIRRYAFAAVCARLATRLATDRRLRPRQAHVSTDWKGLLFPWTYPRRVTTKLIEQQLAAIENFLDLSTTAFSLDYELLSDMFTWDTLGKVLEYADAALGWINQAKGSQATRHTLLLTKIIGQLTNPKFATDVSSGDILQDDAYLSASERDGDIIGASFYWSLIGAIAAIRGKYDEASLAFGHLKKYQQRFGLLVPISPQCRILMIYAEIASLRIRGQSPFRKLLDLRSEIAFVFDLAKANPSGFSWAWNLLCAEIARIFGKAEKAFKYYRLARGKAKDSGYLLPLAFVQECLGRFSFEQHDEVLADQQLREACQLYSLWGCEAKVSQLSREFSQLSSLRPERKVIGSMRTSESTQDRTGKIDVRSVGSRSSFREDASQLSAIIDALMQKRSDLKSLSPGMTAVLDDFMKDNRSKARIDCDKAIADSFRRGVLLEGAEDIPGIDIGIFYQEAQQVGGDFVNYHYDKKSGCLFLQIGDVSGVGPSAVLVSTAVSSAIATQCHALFESVEISSDKLVYEIARAANAAVLRFGTPLNCSMTMAFIVLDIESGQGSFLNAAHMPSYLKHRGEVSALLQRGSHLGEPEFLEQCLVSRFQFDPGDSLFLYTDGLVKNRSLSGQSLSRRRLRKIIGESGDSHAMHQKILTTYSDQIANHTAIDDCVFLTVGRKF